MHFQYLTTINDIKVDQATRLATATEAAMSHYLKALLSPHIKNRKVKFQDAMGYTSLIIAHRRGGEYVISDSSIWWSPAGTWVHGYTAVGNPHTPSWIESIQQLLCEYNTIAKHMFCVEFELEL
jgi:hypothetical protein